MVTASWDTSTLTVLASSATALACTTCCGAIIKPPLPDPNTQGATCGHCSVTQPIKLRVLFEGFIDFLLCVNHDGAFRYAKWPAGTAALLNGYHILDHVGGGLPCTYRKNIPVNVSFSNWSNDTCSDPPIGGSPYTATNLRIQATGIAGGVEFLIQYQSSFSSTVFFGTLVYGSGESCFDTVETASNTFAGGPCATGLVGIATGTMASLEI